MIDMLLMTIVWPASAGGGVLLVGIALQWSIGWPRDHAELDGDDHSPRPAVRPLLLISGAIAATVAFVVSFRYTEGQWPLPPHTRWQWVFLMAVSAGTIGSVNALIPARWLATLPRLILIGAATAIAGAALLRPLPSMEADAIIWPDWLWKGVFGTFVLIIWMGSETTARREHSGWTLLGMVAAFTAASLVIIEAQFAKPAQIAGALAATSGLALTITLALAAFGRRLPIHSGMTPVLAMILPALLVFGVFYNTGHVPVSAFLLVALSPLALLIVLIPPLRAWSGWRWWLLRIVLVLILPAIAVTMTMIREVPPEPAGYEW